LGRVCPEQAFESIDVRPFFNSAVWHLVQKKSKDPFVQWEHVRIARDNHPFERGLRKHLLDISEVGIQAKDGFRFGVIDKIPDLMGRIDGRDGDRYGTDALGPEIGDDKLGAIGNIEHDLVIDPQPQVVKGRGKTVDQLQDFLVRKLFAEIHDGGTVRVFFARPFESGYQRFIVFIHGPSPCSPKSLGLQPRRL
jgi:hypothetical protein